MSCSCGCNPCSCSPRPSVCCTPTVESVEYTFENANLVGIGFFDNETDRLVQFRGAVSNSAALTITLDAANNVLVFDFDDEALVADIPDATTTQRGILETATNTEALAKAATDKILTPSNLAALGSTTTFAGLVELATDAETIAGVSTTLAVTPAGLAAVGSLLGTTTFADSVARAAKVPAFEGQFGGQLDANTPWYAVGTTAGAWGQIVTVNTSLTIVSSSTTWLVDSDWVIGFNGGNGNLTFSDFDFIEFSGGTNLFFAAANMKFLGGNVNFDATAVLQDNGVTVPASSVLTTSTTAGQLSSALINTFVSSQNTQTGYTAFANPATLRTCDTATVTLPQLAQIVGTLIEDLKAIKLPAT